MQDSGTAKSVFLFNYLVNKGCQRCKIAVQETKDFFPSHISSYDQPKTVLLQYKSIVFGRTYELICEETKSFLISSVE